MLSITFNASPISTHYGVNFGYSQYGRVILSHGCNDVATWRGEPCACVKKMVKRREKDKDWRYRKHLRVYHRSDMPAPPFAILATGYATMKLLKRYCRALLSRVLTFAWHTYLFTSTVRAHRHVIAHVTTWTLSFCNWSDKNVLCDSL